MNYTIKINSYEIRNVLKSNVELSKSPEQH